MRHALQKRLFHLLRHQTSEVGEHGLPLCLRCKRTVSRTLYILRIIAEKLLRNLSTAQLIIFFFQVSLVAHSGKRIIRPEILRGNRYDDRRIRIRTVSSRIAHTIDTTSSLFRRSIYHIAARTHTKRIHAASIRKIGSHLVRRSRKLRSPIIAVHDGINHRLRMLHTKSDSKVFHFHRDLFLGIQHLKRISCTVSQSKNDRRSRIGFLFGHNRGNPSVLDHKILHAAFKMKFRAFCDQILSHVPDHL